MQFSVAAFTAVNSCCSLFQSCCLDCLKLKIISLSNCAVLVEGTLSGVQSYHKWAFRVIVLVLLELNKTPKPNSLHLSFPLAFLQSRGAFLSDEVESVWKVWHCMRAFCSSAGLKVFRLCSVHKKIKKRGKKFKYCVFIVKCLSVDLDCWFVALPTLETSPTRL